MLERT